MSKKANVGTTTGRNSTAIAKLVMLGLQESLTNVSSVRLERAMAGSGEQFEGFVDADEAARFLSITRRRVLDLARAGILPAHPIGLGARRVWRFRLSELAAALLDQSRIRFAPRTGRGMVRPQAVPDATGGD